MYDTISYLIYLALSVLLTVWIQRALRRNGFHFLLDGFEGNVELAQSTNQLLSIGFYLVNLGFVMLRMESRQDIDTIEALILYLTSNLGVVLLLLGLMHFLNMLVIQHFGRRGTAWGRRLPAPSYGDLARERTSTREAREGAWESAPRD